MSRSLLSLLALSCVFAVGCPGGTGDDTKPVDDTGATDDSGGGGGGDEDGDGYTPSQGDCDDSNPAIHPGAVELCYGIDNNCDNLFISAGPPTSTTLDTVCSNNLPYVWNNTNYYSTGSYQVLLQGAGVNGCD